MTFAGPQLQRLLVEFGDKMGDFCGDERILAENRRLNVAWVSTQLRLYWRKEGVYASYTPRCWQRGAETAFSPRDRRRKSENELLLGEAGKGWGYSTATLNNERLVNAAFCLGMLDGVLEDALEHLQTRRAFGHVIGEFQALQHYVADIAMWQKQGELMLLHGARLQSVAQQADSLSQVIENL